MVHSQAEMPLESCEMSQLDEETLEAPAESGGWRTGRDLNEWLFIKGIYPMGYIHNTS